jgi:hypothetical protein
MEGDVVTTAREAIQSLELNRAVVRGLLLPNSAAGGGPDVFPRSYVMRLLLDPRKRRLAYGIFAAAWMVMGRRKQRAHRH